MVGVSTVTKTHWFGFTDAELEIANSLIQGGWYSDMYSLHGCAELLQRAQQETQQEVTE